MMHSIGQALAFGNCLLQAFTLAKQHVRISLRVKEAHIEVDKIVLLPPVNKDTFHEVQVLFTESAPLQMPGCVQHS